MACLISVNLQKKNHYSQGIVQLSKFSSPHLVKGYYVADPVLSLSQFFSSSYNNHGK